MHPDEEERRRARMKKIISWIIVVLMVASVLGGYFGSSDNSVRYNGHKFTPTSQGLASTINGERYIFNSYPASLETLPMDAGAYELISVPFLTFTYDSESNWSQTMAAVQYYYAELFGARFDTYVQPAILANSTFGLPLAGCQNATTTQPVILLREDNETSIKLEENCIIGTAASNEDVLRIADKLLLLRLGVIK